MWTIEIRNFDNCLENEVDTKSMGFTEEWNSLEKSDTLKILPCGNDF